MGNKTVLAVRRELTLASRNGALPGDETDAVFGRLFRALVTLKFEPGAIVTEADLMKFSSATRAPLRHALARLEELGLVTALARKGILVNAISAFDVSTLYEARIIIEGQVARLAAQRATDADLAVLKTLAANDQVPSADGQPVDEDYPLSHDQALHIAIADAAHNPVLLETVVRILAQSCRLWYWAQGNLGLVRSTMFSHEEMIAAIVARDPDAAEAALVAHLSASRELIGDQVMFRLRGA